MSDLKKWFTWMSQCKQLKLKILKYPNSIKAMQLFYGAFLL